MARSKRSSGRNSKRRRSMRRRRQSGGGWKHNVHWQNFFDVFFLPDINSLIHNDELKIILYFLISLRYMFKTKFDENLILAKVASVIGFILKLDLLYSVYNRNKTGRIETNKLFGYNLIGKSKSISIEKTNWTWVVMVGLILELANHIRTLKHLLNVNTIQDFDEERMEEMKHPLTKLFSIFDKLEEAQ